VGGPDQGDNYDDRRDDYVKNEVACDHNCGFQGALAGRCMRHRATCDPLVCVQHKHEAQKVIDKTLYGSL